MNTNRIFLGDIDEIKNTVNYQDHNILFGEDIITVSFALKKREKVPYKRKVVLVKFPENNYVELSKLKSFKDIIKVYFDIVFNNTISSLYLLREYEYFTEKYFIRDKSITKYEGNLKNHETLKSLRKKLLK